MKPNNKASTIKSEEDQTIPIWLNSQKYKKEIQKRMERTVTVDEYVDRSIAAPKTHKKNWTEVQRFLIAQMNGHS